MNKKIVAIDLFCGAGGLTRGLLDAGIDVIGGIDIDEDASVAYEKNNIRKNKRKCQYIKKDISSVTGKDLKKMMFPRINKSLLLAGCAPCQPFSARNNNKSNRNDKRRNLLLEFARLVEETKPDFVFMENVPGILKDNKNIFELFLRSLKKTGFKDTNIVYQIINAKDYGVPQNRRRFVLLAAKHKNIEFPKPLYSKKKYKTVKNAISKLPEINVGEQHDKLKLHKCSNLSDLNQERLRLIKKDRTELPEHLVLKCHKKTKGHNDAYGRMDWEKPAPALTTKFYSITNGRYAHPTQNRGISLLEGSLLQSFKRGYSFYGNMQTIARQIGNAVPPVMAKNLSQIFK